MKAILIRLYQTVMVVPMVILLLISLTIAVLMFMLWCIGYWIITDINYFNDNQWGLIVDKLLIIYNKIMLINFR